MSEKPRPPLSISQTPAGYRLTKRSPDGPDASVELSEDDIIVFSQYASVLQADILKRRNPDEGGMPSKFAITAVQALVGTDAHQTEGLVTLLDRGNSEFPFVLSRDLMIDLAKALLECAQTISTASRNQTKQ